MTNETMAPEDQELQEPTPAHRRIQRPTRTTTPLERPGPIEIPSPPTLGAEISPTPFQFLLPVVGALTSVVMMVVMRNGQPLFMLIAAVVFTVALVSGLGFAISSRGRAGKQLRLHRSRYLDYLERTGNRPSTPATPLWRCTRVRLGSSVSSTTPRGCGNDAAPTPTTFRRASGWRRCRGSH